MNTFDFCPKCTKGTRMWIPPKQVVLCLKCKSRFVSGNKIKIIGKRAF